MHKLQLLLFALFASAMIVQTHAQGEKWSDDVTAITPVGDIYRVTTAQELAWVAQEVNKKAIPDNKVFELQNNLDLGGKEWTPIGIQYKYFVGVFRGNNHTISNLTITKRADGFGLGLFGYVNKDSKISDLTLKDVNIQISDALPFTIGSLCAQAFYAEIKNCHATGTISSTFGNTVSVGGLIGSLQHTTVDRSSTNITYTITDIAREDEHNVISIGGIAGGANGDEITNSFSSGEIKAASNWDSSHKLKEMNAGGLVGRSYGNVSIINSFSNCNINPTGIPTIKKPYYTEIRIGGLLGFADSKTIITTISNSFYMGTITPIKTATAINYNGLVIGEGIAENMTFDNSFFPTGNAIGNNAGTTPEGLQNIPDDLAVLTGSLNAWEKDQAAGKYLPWEMKDGSPSLIVEKSAEAGTDYEWNENTCTLKTKTGLLWFADEVNKQHNTFTGKTVMLAVTAEGWDMNSKEWNPIGWEENTVFSGTFDGNNQEVKIYINCTIAFKDPRQGFFCKVKKGTIQNLTVNGAVSYKEGYAAIVVGEIEGSTITNVTSKGTVSGRSNIGGITSKATDCTITDCHNEATVTGEILHNAGGIAAIGEKNKVEGCTNSGAITGTYNIGGIIGTGKSGLTVNDCTNSGEITATKTSSIYTVAAGGIVGNLDIWEEEDATIINTINTGTVSTYGLGAGGIVGFAEGLQVPVSGNAAKINIINSENSGKISGRDHVGGIGMIQTVTGMSITVDNCFSNGEVSSTGKYLSTLITTGSIDGTASINHCFYKEQEGIKAITGEKDPEEHLTVAGVATIPTDEATFIYQLNERAKAYNAANPQATPTKGWTKSKDGNLKLGAFPPDAPTIEGNTSFTSSTLVSLKAAAGTSIYYTLDGSAPTTGSTLYTASFMLTASTTVKAIAIAVIDEEEIPSNVAVQTFTKIEIPPVVYHYQVTLPAIEGVTTNPAAGSYEVEEWTNFSFALTLNEGYGSSIPVVTVNGEVLTPRQSDGRYVIRYLNSDITISITGIVKDEPTAVLPAPATGSRIGSQGNRVQIYTPKPQQVQIISYSGAVIRKFTVPGGDYSIQMPSGLYIVCIDNGTTGKVQIR